MFHVPSSRSGDAGIRAEDQHRFIVLERCQSPAPHDSLTLRPRQYIQSQKVIKIPTFLLWVPGHGPYGHTWLGHNNLQFIKTFATDYLRARGCPLLATGVKRPCPADDHGIPRAPWQQLHRLKYLQHRLQFTQYLADTWVRPRQQKYT